MASHGRLDSLARKVGDPQAAVCAHLLRRLVAAGLPFLVGGTFALTRYTGLGRETKDLDLFVERRHLDPLLAELAAFGMRTSLPFPHWLAKATCRHLACDIIFGSGNGLTPVDAEWFQHAHDASLYGVPVRLVPPEELLWSKAFIMERERFDGADVAHLLRGQGHLIDWARVERRFGDHLPVLLAHLDLFHYIYDDAEEHLPDGLRPRLRARVEARGRPADVEGVCRGTLLSREQFLPDVAEAGYLDGRVVTGVMTEDEVQQWTDAIATPEWEREPARRRFRRPA